MTSDEHQDVWETIANDNDDDESVPWALQLMQGPSLLQTIRLESDITYIGRMPENHVVIDDEQASRSHARIIHENDQFRLEDQESQNGTFVNGKKIKEKVLVLGDIIRIGKISLQIVEASASVKFADRQEHLAMTDEEEEEWRLDQTVNMASEELKQKVLDKIRAKRSEKEKRETLQPPKLDLSLSLGNKRFEKSVTFKKGKRRPENDPKGDSIVVHIRVGKWILEDEIPLS